MSSALLQIFAFLNRFLFEIAGIVYFDCKTEALKHYFINIMMEYAVFVILLMCVTISYLLKLSKCLESMLFLWIQGFLFYV